MTVTLMTSMCKGWRGDMIDRVHPVLVAIAMSAFAFDTVVMRHPVSFKESSKETHLSPGPDVLDARSARLASRNLTVSLVMPLVCAGVIVLGSYCALQMTSALFACFLSSVGSRSNRSLAGVMSWNAKTAMGSLRDVLTKPDPEFMPASHMRALISACVSASFGGAAVAGWAAKSSSRDEASNAAHGPPRGKVRMALVLVWLATALVATMFMIRTRKGA